MYKMHQWPGKKLQPHSRRAATPARNNLRENEHGTSALAALDPATQRAAAAFARRRAFALLARGRRRRSTVASAPAADCAASTEQGREVVTAPARGPSTIADPGNEAVGDKSKELTSMTTGVTVARTASRATGCPTAVRRNALLHMTTNSCMRQRASQRSPQDPRPSTTVLNDETAAPGKHSTKAANPGRSRSCSPQGIREAPPVGEANTSPAANST